MSPRVLPTLAAATAARRRPVLLVGTRRGAVLHLAAADCQDRCAVTATGRLRRGQHILCGQRGRAWRRAAEPFRPLCSYCAAAAGTPADADWRRLTALDVLWALRHAVTADDLAAARRAMCESGLVGITRLPDGTAVRLSALLVARTDRVRRGRWTPADTTWALARLAA